MGNRVLRIIGLGLGAFALQFTAACSTLGGDGGASTRSSAPSPALWRVADKDTTIYLFGTVHALPRDLVWYEPHIARALEASSQLVTEVDAAEAAKMPDLVAAKAVLPEGQTLRSLMSEEDRQAYDEVLVSLGLPVQSFDAYKPWFAAITLSLLPILNAGYETESGVEEVLLSKIHPDTTRHALETVEYQLDLFDQLPLEAQLTYLKQVVDSAPELTSQLDQMVGRWLAGDAKALAELMNAQETDPELYERLITTRNANWAVWIDDRLDEPGTVFVAVGAGHLAGKGSVQEQLKRRGISSARVK
ncbi:MAG TPA: TraB/GumN family protein [Sphingomonadaceae bacterium]|nr:TraB/GumN family protein [Sphingomonadaceae bacterium]